MTLTIDLPAELDERLRREAGERGLSADQYALRVLERDLSPMPEPRRSLQETLSPEEWVRELEAFWRSHKVSAPLLPDAAVSRESFYEGRP